MLEIQSVGKSEHEDYGMETYIHLPNGSTENQQLKNFSECT